MIRKWGGESRKRSCQGNKKIKPSQVLPEVECYEEGVAKILPEEGSDLNQDPLYLTKDTLNMYKFHLNFLGKRLE